MWLGLANFKQEATSHWDFDTLPPRTLEGPSHMIGKWLKVLGQALPLGEILGGMKNNILQHDRFQSVKIKDIRVLLLGSVGLSLSCHVSTLSATKIFKPKPKLIGADPFSCFSCDAFRVCGCYFGLLFMFSNFYRLDLHNKTWVAVANLRWGIRKNWTFLI